MTRLPSPLIHLLLFFVLPLTALSQTLRPEIREFTRAADGKKLKAFIVSSESGQVTIQLAGQKRFTLDSKIFTEEDQKYIRDWELKKLGVPLRSDLDTRIEPGALFRVEIPNLEKTRQGTTAGFEIRIPENFNYPDPVPLLVYFSGGKGDDKVAPAIPLVNESRFVIAAFPFPESITSGKLSMAKADEIGALHAYHTTMLSKLTEILPNIHSHHKFVAGSSNGGHTIGSTLVEDLESFTDFFHGYILFEGGRSPLGKEFRGGKGRDKVFFIGWGEDSPFKKDVQQLIGLYEDSGLRVWKQGVPNTGHGMTPQAKAMVKDWIETVAIPEIDKAQR